MQRFVDLHTHSTASDGTFSPRAVVRAAADAGLAAVALTDHDTVAGVADAADEAARSGIAFLPGIEISCAFPRPGTLHLLGYGIDPTSSALAALTRRLIEGREQRNRTMVQAMAAAGIRITEAEVLERAAGGVVGRPHIAALLVAKGYAENPNDAFKRYLGQGGQFYADKETTTSRQAIGMIHDAGGIAVLAHPVQLKRENDAQLLTVVKSLVDQGLDGIEVIHSEHRASLIDRFEDIAARYGLVTTGGSDFHGGQKPHIKLGWAGKRRVPFELFDGLLKRLGPPSL